MREEVEEGGALSQQAEEEVAGGKDEVDYVIKR